MFQLQIQWKMITLIKLEQEANLRGTMTFRNWTDSLNEGKDPFCFEFLHL